MSDREARRAAVSCIRVSSGGGTKEEELALLAVLQVVGMLVTSECRLEALDIVGRPVALGSAGCRTESMVMEFVRPLAGFEGSLWWALVALEIVGTGLDERSPGTGMEFEEDSTRGPGPGL